VSSTEPTTATPATQPASKIRGALLRYRVLAWVTGLWLLLLVVELIAKYGFGVDALDFVPIVHGWVYFVYLIMAIDLSIRVRWPIGKTVVTLIAGTIPFLSFYVEHIRTREVRAQFDV
jgi:integral membrane protein